MALIKDPNKNVKFIKLSETQYQEFASSNQIVEGAIYFTDAGCLYLDSIAYGVGSEKTVKDVSIHTVTTEDLTEHPTWVVGEKVLEVSYGKGANSDFITGVELVDLLPAVTSTKAGLMSPEDKAKLDALTELESGEAFYTPNESLSDITSVEHGGLESKTGAEFTAAKMTFSQMFDAILFPTVNPDVTNPSITSYSVINPAIVEVGTIIPGEGTYAFSRGSVSLDGVVKCNAYSGEETSHSVIVTDSLVPGTSLMPAKKITYTLTVNYGAGIYQPVNNKGENHGTTCPAGSVASSVDISAAYAFFATTDLSDGTHIVKQNLIANSGLKSVTTGSIVMAPHNSATKSKIKLPNRPLTGMQMLNPVSGKYEAVSYASWVHSEETDNGITYHIYEYDGDDRGSVTLKLTF